MTGRLISAAVLVLAASLLITGSAVGDPPTVSIDQPAEGAALADPTPQISGTATSSGGNVTVEVSNGTNVVASFVEEPGLTWIVNDADWATTATPPLAEGSYTVTAEQDEAVAVPHGFTVDITVPTPTFLAKPTDRTNQTLAHFELADTELNVVFECKVDTDADFAACPASIDLIVLEGVHTIEVRAKDSLGNTSAVATYTWTVDITVPVVTITSPPGAVLLNDATPTISGSASEPSDVTVKIWSGGDTSVAPLAIQAASPAAGVWSLDLVALADGPYTVAAGQTDAAGNAGESAPSSFTIDAPTARVDVLSARPGDHRATLTWRKPPDADLLRVVVRRGTTVVYRGLEKESLIDRGLYNGTVYTYRFTAVDVAGNVSAVTSVKVKPRGKLWSPRDGGVIRVAPTLQWAKVSRATYYNVQLWRNGRKILSRWPTRPTYELRMRWRYGGRVRNLRDGTYLWYVWPGFGDRERGRYGRMLGSATFFKR